MSSEFETTKIGPIRNILVKYLDKVTVHDFNQEEFKTFLINLLVTRGNVKQEIAEQLLDQDGLNRMKVAFTTASMLESTSLEFFESMGDLTVNKAIGWYMFRRFPEIQANPQAAMYMCELKKKYISKNLFAPFCKSLGLDKFIRYKEIKILEPNNNIKTIILDKSMLEDVFEAFCACLEDLIDNRIVLNSGYGVVYNIITSLLDAIPISIDIDELVDKKTQIKELMDKRRPLGDKGPIYKYEKDGFKWITTLELVLTTHPNGTEGPEVIKFVSPPMTLKMEGEFNTAEQALKWFERYGVKWSR